MGARDGDHSLSELGVARGSGHLQNFVKSQTAKQTKQLKVEEWEMEEVESEVWEVVRGGCAY